MNRKQMLREIEDLLRIPTFERIFYHKVQELKENVSRNPEQYFEILEKQEQERKTYPFGLIDFELHLFGKSIWIPVLPGKDFDAYELISDEIVDYIVRIETEPGMPNMRNNVSFEDGRKTVDLTFIKYDADLYSGTIFFKQSGEDAEPGAFPVSRSRELGDPADKIYTLKLLFQYLWENEEFLKCIFSEFRLRWKPLIDSESIPNAK